MYREVLPATFGAKEMLPRPETVRRYSSRNARNQNRPKCSPHDRRPAMMLLCLQGLKCEVLRLNCRRRADGFGRSTTSHLR